MPPPVRAFHASALPQEIQLDAAGRKRKPAPGAAAADVDLRGCELMSMSQYECTVPRPEDRESRVQCFEVVRFFRRCADKKGHFMVETTNWEQQQQQQQQQQRTGP